ncbi:MAG: sulfur carrier protein ThiS adenylyltransferase ThiF [Planctomycetota bacterium]|nr:sulfur carrier protein ThiS adenylyltransferase ThiF [Planctomycetota bacterium]
MHELASLFLPGADIAVVNGMPRDLSEWPGIFPGASADVVLARRGEMSTPGAYAALVAARNPPGVTETLARATVGIAGCGGLGSHAALALARLGVGKLVLADFDVVEPTNLNRQAFFAGDIGEKKAPALARQIGRVNPVVRTEAHDLRLDPDNIPGVFRECGILLECLDAAEAKQMLVETALDRLPEVTVVAVSGLAGLGDGNAVRTRKAASRLWLVGDGESAIEDGIGLAAPRVLVAAGQQALCAARVLLGMRD